MKGSKVGSSKTGAGRKKEKENEKKKKTTRMEERICLQVYVLNQEPGLLETRRAWRERCLERDGMRTSLPKSTRGSMSSSARWRTIR